MEIEIIIYGNRNNTKLSKQVNQKKTHGYILLYVWYGKYNILYLNPITCKLDQAKESFSITNINLPSSLHILYADPIPLLQVEQPSGVAHHLHGHPPVFLAL